MRSLALIACLCFLSSACCAQLCQPGFYEVHFKNGKKECGEILSVTDNGFEFSGVRGHASLPWNTVERVESHTQGSVYAKRALALFEAGDAAQAIELGRKARQQDPAAILSPELDRLLVKQERADAKQIMHRRGQMMDALRSAVHSNDPDHGWDVLAKAVAADPKNTDLLELGLDSERLIARDRLQIFDPVESIYAQRLREVAPDSPFVAFLDREAETLRNARAEDKAKSGFAEIMLRQAQEEQDLIVFQRFMSMTNRQETYIDKAERNSYLNAKHQHAIDQYHRMGGAGSPYAANATVPSGIYGSLMTSWQGDEILHKLRMLDWDVSDLKFDQD